MKTSTPFKIRKVAVVEHGFRYETFSVQGWLHGRRVRKRFKDHAEAAGYKARLDIESGNAESALRVAPTRLTDSQIAEAEYGFRRLGKRCTLTGAIEWYLANYRPPTVEIDLSEAIAIYLKSKTGRVNSRHLAEIRRQLLAFGKAFPATPVHSIKRKEISAYLESKTDWQPKTWNNVRGVLHSFFGYALDQDRGWTVSNPVVGTEQKVVARGLPEIMEVGQVRALFEFLETYTGSSRRPSPPGFLVPYFALATFAGLRPGFPGGELWKMHRSGQTARYVDTKIGVIRVTPEVAKTGDIRQVQIRPNLEAWLTAYPVDRYPLVMTNMADLLGLIRKKFGLGHDVLRHTFISMHVAQFKSLGAAALEAGNSESVIRKHYLNLVSASDAQEFWSILPQCAASVDALRSIA